MGINVQVFHNSLGDCTNNGISSKAKRLCIINVPGPFEPTAEIPAAVLIPHKRLPNLPIIRPADENGQPIKTHSMFGGNYAAGGDDRFDYAVKAICDIDGGIGIKIFDRIE